jgi:hypothetical protein
MSYISDLKDAIKRLHGCDSDYLESVPIVERFQDKPVWDGVVEVFALHGHPKAIRCYAWSHPKDDGGEHFVTVLELPPVDSPQKAVQVSILADSKKSR